MGIHNCLIGSGLCAALLMATAAPADENISGLWVGAVHVGDVQAPDGTMEPTSAHFAFKLIIHVDGDRAATLVNQAVIARSSQGAAVLTGNDVTLGRLSRLPDEALAGAEKFATAGYDMDGGSAALTGQFGSNYSLSTNLTIGAESDANPFRHRFHPDHDNLSNEGAPLETDAEVYALSREMTFTFNPDLSSNRRVGGVFSEMISGLRVRPIKVSGLFVLEQVYSATESEK